MSKYIDELNNYNVQEFLEFLRINELSEFEIVAKRKFIDGHTFLNLAEFEINNWKPFLNRYQAQKFWSFLNQLLQYPEKFTYLHAKPTVPAKPSVSRDYLQKLSQNESFLHSLRNAVQSRVSGQQSANETEKLIQNNDRRDERDSALPPRPPVFNRPGIRSAKYPSTDSESHDDNEEVVYESPDDHHEEVNQNKTHLTQKTQKPLPELPAAFAKQANLYDDPDDKPQVVNEEKVGQRKQFTLQHHYAKQREREREIAAKASQRIGSKQAIQTNPLPPVPTPTLAKEVSPKAKVAEKINAIPRPPVVLPRVDVQKLPDSPDPPTQKPMEQESYYRYTDRKGAEQLLSEPFDDGTYLVRPSRSYHGTLSVKHSDKVYHIGIKKVDGNMLEMESSGLNLKFSNLNEITDYFKGNPLSVRNKYNEIIDIYLGGTLPADRT